ncbi:MAG: carotenoid oxygenase [Rubrivivax sp.]|nr:MAG: carotenoid oxygenase [Rubrivivax sp.]
MSSLTIKERAVAWLGHHLQARVPYSDSNMYLEGMYAPVQHERSETRLRVTGELPRELNGVYARIGPNPMSVSNPGAYHWFTGAGMVHGVRLEDGHALWYRNRWIGSDSVRARQGLPRVPGPRRGVSDVVNTNVFGHGGRIWAAVEAGTYPVELDGELETVKHGLFDSSAVPKSFTAHPKLDPATGDMHAICYDALNPKRIHHMVIDPQCRVTKVVELPVQHGPMIHDCAITRSQVIVLDLPVTFSFKHVLRGVSLPYGWNPKHQARVGLLPRNGEAHDIRWIDIEPCYVFHTCNAHDLDDGGVLLDVVVHDRMFDRSRIGPEPDRHITFERWHIDPARSTVKRTVISDCNQEFPRCNELLSTRPYRYAYTVGFTNMDAVRTLMRHDLHTGSTLTHDHGLGRSTGEAVFVPRQTDGRGAEDDGWLVSYVYDANTDRSDLVVLNAQDLSGPPQAIVHLPVRVPAGFHGNWIPDVA